jgi:hypothetical protein
MNELSINETSTPQRKIILSRYCRENIQLGDQFTCQYFNQCRSSHQGIFYEGQLHHVGNHYDMSTSGLPFQVMVVGQEYGHGPSLVSMDDRSQMVLVQTGLNKTFANRNPHMRGTTSALRQLFGIPLGGDHSDEYLQSPGGERFHIFDAFALVNYLLCSAVSLGEGRRGKSTSIMRKNCLVHFKNAIEILEPTVVVVQGKSFWASVQNAFSKLKKINDALYSAEINHQKVMIAVFTHPSTPDNTHNWGRDAKTPYLLGTVVPTIQFIRQELLTTSTPKGGFSMPSNSEPTPILSNSISEQPTYNEIFDLIKAGLIQRFLPNILQRKPDFRYSHRNRMQIMLDRISGSHYQITFMRDRYEFALHFESSPPISLTRRKAFDPHLQELTSQVGQLVKSGPIENKGWMGVWYERKVEMIDQEKVKLYIDQFSKFISATFPILAKLYYL